MGEITRLLNRFLNETTGNSTFKRSKVDDRHDDWQPNIVVSSGLPQLEGWQIDDDDARLWTEQDAEWEAKHLGRKTSESKVTENRLNQLPQLQDLLEEADAWQIEKEINAAALRKDTERWKAELITKRLELEQETRECESEIKALANAYEQRIATEKQRLGYERLIAYLEDHGIDAMPF